MKHSATLSYSIAVGLLAQFLCSVAVAQSAVSIYGSIDNGVTYVNNVRGESSLRLQDGINRANALGFMGTEDLGGGKKALFKLETGFNVNSGALGQGGLIFGKQAFVGIADASMGQVTFGRQYDFALMMLRYLPCAGCGLYSVQNADFDRISGQRLNNSVQFQSRDFGGMKLGAMYALGDRAAGTTNIGRAYSFNAEYTNGPFSAGAFTTNINNSAVLTGVLGATSALGAPVSSLTMLVDNQRILGVGAASTFGPLRTSFVYTNTRLELGARASTDQVLYLGADYRITPSMLILGKVSTDRFEDSRWNTINLGLNYFLSKRTELYIDAAYQHASGRGTRASIPLTPGPSSSNTQAVTRVGIKHFF